MDDERWRRVSAIFHEALTRDPAARGGFLDDACADDRALRADVDSLLAADRDARRWDSRQGVPTATARTLLPGTTIGGHRIEARIGAGGMGEVYRAHDPHLNRPVAIKVLSAAAFLDAAARQRLVREARAAAALNHPNVCTIYEVGQVDDEAFIVMELVDGRGLDTLIPATGLPVDQVLGYARQLADALAHAHERGIVHRDLKPANIKVNADGILKVLDFGLAKRSVGISTEASTDLTEPGTVLGTAIYMSPEQAQGQEVDNRTDIWSYGVVLFELVTGRVPFSGDSFAALAAAVLRTEPDWTRVPIGMRRLLRACLEKDPKRRLRHIADAWRLVEDADETRPRAMPWWPAAAAVLLVLVSAVWAFWPAPETPAAVQRWSITLMEPGGGERGVALSPDGTMLAYTGRVLPVRPIWVRALNETEGRPIPQTDGGRRPFFSPDGKWLAYFSSFGRSSLMKVPLAGGAPTRLCEVANFLGGSWGEDDHIVFTAPDGLMRVSASGGACEPLTLDRDDSRPMHRFPQILPGGKTVLFGIASAEGAEASQIALLDLGSREQRVLDQRGTKARYLPSGHLVYVRDASMFAVPFDMDRLRTTGPEFLAFDGVLWDPQNGNADYTVSAAGTLVYTAEETVHRTLAWVDGGDRIRPSSAPAREYGSVSISPDGRRAATFLTRGGAGIFIVDLERGTLSRIAERGSFPRWTPDGAQIIYSRLGELFRVPADGSGAQELLATDTFATVNSISPDGRTLAYTAASSADVKSRRTLKLLDLAGGSRSAVPFSMASNHNEADGQISPDGKWMAYVSDESGTDEVYVRAYPGRGRKTAISVEGGAEPRWASRPQRLFFRDRRTNHLMVADAAAIAAATAARPQRVLSMATSLWDVAPEGKQFLVVTDPEPAADAATVHVVVNWTEELKRQTR
jgi:Tol biopolymer transport system component